LFWYFGHPSIAIIFGFAVVLARLDRILDEVKK
jgi:heme/copper-type cytochrome/quinol oxidase subunit 1